MEQVNYKLVKPRVGTESNTVQRLPDGMFIPFNDQNMHYKEYLEWLEEGNTPLPADEPNEGTV